MRRITATDAARNFASLLDDVERNGERFVIERRGRVVARVEPAAIGNGRSLKDLLAATPVDEAWAGELASMRSGLRVQSREWPG